MLNTYLNQNSANQLAQEVSTGAPILRGPRQQTGRKGEKWSKQLEKLCKKVSTMEGLFKAGYDLEPRYLRMAQSRLDKIAAFIPKKWFFQSPEQKKIEKAQTVVKTLLEPDAVFKREEALRCEKPSYSILPPLKVFNTFSLLCVLCFGLAAPVEPKVQKQEPFGVKKCPLPSSPIDLPTCRLSPKTQVKKSVGKVDAVLGGLQKAKGEKKCDLSSLSRLKQRASELRTELVKTMGIIPSDRSPQKEKEEWFSRHNDQCRSVEMLENNLKNEMKAARCALPSDEDASHGNKHKNLVKMNHLLRLLELSDVEVPLPRGISSDQVHAFLQKEAPEVFVRWESLAKLKLNWDPAKGRFLENDEVIASLNSMDQAIERAFNKEGAFERLSPSKELRDWLSECQKTGDSLMVRSTGSEDSRETANAGGNVSKAYVAPEKGAFCEAVGAVVQSYFGKNSLQNRINAEIDPFQEKLKLAVTAQQLIGEPVGGAVSPNEIPVSFVLFTNEPLYVGNEKFRATRISATFGHGEAVVSSQGIATDTALILQSEAQPDQLYILYDNQLKLERLAPLEKEGAVHLSKVSNPSSLQERRALSEEQLIRIYSSGVLMEGFFDDNATDIEGVMKNGQVNFVQARPINRKPLLPTYLDANQASLRKVQAEMVVPGKASVVVIEKKGEVLHVATLEEAEKKFQKNVHKLIVVNQPEPENSHPVVNFSGLGIPCLYKSDEQEVRDLLDAIDKTHPLAVCMQTATLHLWDGEQSPLDAQIREGFAVHPAKIAISLQAPTLSGPSIPVPEEIKSLLSKLHSHRSEALNSLNQLEQLPFIRNLETRIADLEAKGAAAPEIRDRLEALKTLQRTVARAFQETKSSLLRPDQRLQPLLHVKILETLIGGKKESPTRLGSYSLMDADALIKSVETLISYQGELTETPACLSLLLQGENAAPEAFAEWRQLLLKLEPLIASGKITGRELEEFKELIGTLQKTGALPFWLTFFQEGREEPIEQFKKILEQTSPSDKNLMGSLAKEQRNLDQIKNQLDRFGDPKSFPQAKQELLTYIERYSSPDWIAQVNSSSPLVKTVAYRTMERAVDLFDSAIKTMKSSQQFASDIEKVKLFKEMLHPYYTLMRSWATRLVPENTFQFAAEGTLSDYLARIQRLLSESSDNDSLQLNPTRSFSVSAAMLGSMALFGRHEPRSLEDILTLLHQNSLACITTMNQKVLTPHQVAHSYLPQIMKETVQKIEQGEWGITVQRIGMQVTEKEIIIRYNIPLRNHSGHINLHYDVLTGKMNLKGQLLGEARDRWPNTAIWVRALQTAGIFSVERPLFQGNQELSFSWFVNPNRVDDPIREYAAMAHYSINNGLFDDILSALYARYENRDEIQGLMNHFNQEPTPDAHLFYDRYLEKPFDQRDATEVLGTITSICFSTQNSLRAFWVDYCIEATTNGKETSVDDFLKSAPIDKRSKNIIRQTALQGPSALSLTVETAKTLLRNPWKIHEGRELFTHLLSQVLSQDKISLVVKALSEGALDNTNLSMRKESLQLFQAAIEKEQGIEAAIQAASNGFPDIHWSIRDLSAELFMQLIAKGHGIEAAIETANKGLLNTDSYIRQLSLQLFDWLVAKGYGIEAAIEAANKGLLDANWSVRCESFPLFMQLIANGHGIEAAIEAANKGLLDTNSYIRQLSSLLIETVNKFKESVKIT